MMREYAIAYLGPPAPSMPWPLFLALLHGAPMVEARRELTMRAAIGGSLGSDPADAERDVHDLLRRAYPVKGRVALPMVENLWAPPPPEPSSGG
jgi:hypothetical protein